MAKETAWAEAMRYRRPWTRRQPRKGGWRAEPALGRARDQVGAGLE